MKRIIIAVAVAFVLALSFSSCRTSEKCPAYGTVEDYQIDRPD